VTSESQLDRGRWHDLGRLLNVAAALSMAVLAGRLASLTWPAALVVGLVGGTVVGLSLQRSPTPGRRAPDRIDPVGAAAWLALVVAVLAWELIALLQGSTAEHPSLSVLLDPLLNDPVVRSAAFLGWLSLGVYLLRR
jgi:hypothetical protein